ncbi:specific RNA polymerase II transcription factor [Colletotrichum higginsianum]|uniref:Specific RNA polymerase II transcription factor n=1 Tax=Colletotrichum higginsianum (strain IMI 349063) TaxID=759273 RepID=H1VW57_COLHI|nr:specific RNA polymerase II transcription factor [Colletotrichum higginsianum]
MAPPNSYRYGYHVPSMGGPIMSNLTSPGHQMSLVPGMGVPGGYGAHHLGTSMYGHGHGGQPNPQTERPFNDTDLLKAAVTRTETTRTTTAVALRKSIPTMARRR